MRHIVSAYPSDHLGVNTITLDPMWRSPFGSNGYMASTLTRLLTIAGGVLLLGHCAYRGLLGPHYCAVRCGIRTIYSPLEEMNAAALVS